MLFDYVNFFKTNLSSSTNEMTDIHKWISFYVSKGINIKIQASEMVVGNVINEGSSTPP